MYMAIYGISLSRKINSVGFRPSFVQFGPLFANLTNYRTQN